MPSGSSSFQVAMLAEIALDLGLRGEDDRGGFALDDRLDNTGDAAQQLQQLRLAQILGRLAERLRFRQPGRQLRYGRAVGLA